ncbi:Regulator of ribonuclease activity B [Acinetobacter baumannii]|nr:ribonuclease E inhibitor RraB [Providencia stuartii]NMT49313.1 ribonuclease E inhibitor RraB [Providencia stuartii]QIB31684.1 ribonuclease E inhibitor RraB [Providencia stuartii]SST03672.1 Regulator of ribonuclease activity B [Acinetobacter baumannii]
MVSLAALWENGLETSDNEKRGVDMVDKAELEAQYEETRLIIEELLEDGSDPDALYAIEHHFSADNFELLEKAAVEAFKLGYEVTDAEELEVENGVTLMCCDVISESALNAELIDAQVEQLMKLAEKLGINYDGWGTYFEDPDAEYDDEDEDGEEDGERFH